MTARWLLPLDLEKKPNVVCPINRCDLVFLKCGGNLPGLNTSLEGAFVDGARSPKSKLGLHFLNALYVHLTLRIHTIVLSGICIICYKSDKYI